MGIKPKQQLFALEYLKDLNAAGAYRRSGYKGRGNTAEVEACRLLRNPKVKAIIDRELTDRHERLKMTADEVVEAFSRIARANMKDYAEWGSSGVTLRDSKAIPDEFAACVQEISEGPNGVRFKLHSKAEALTALAKYFNLFEDPETRRQTRSVTINIIEGKASPKVINGEDDEPPPPDPGDGRRIEIRLPD